MAKVNEVKNLATHLQTRGDASGGLASSEEEGPMSTILSPAHHATPDISAVSKITDSVPQVHARRQQHDPNSKTSFTLGMIQQRVR